MLIERELIINNLESNLNMEAILITRESSLESIFNNFKDGHKYTLQNNFINYTSIDLKKFVNIRKDNSMKDDFEDSELISALANFPEPNYFYIDFNNFQLFKNLIKIINFKCLVYNDNGRFYQAEEVEGVQSYEVF